MSAKDHSRGSPLATTTLVAYGDFASPACAQTYLTVKKIQRKMGARLRYVYRSFPQPERFSNSVEASEAAECASSQGKFWEMHDVLFEGKAPVSEIQLHRLAAEAGLNVLQFRRDMQSGARARRVHEVREGGVRSGVAEAPAFFINSIRHESSFGVATLLAAVQAASARSVLPTEQEIPTNHLSRGERQGQDRNERDPGRQLKVSVLATDHRPAVVAGTRESDGSSAPARLQNPRAQGRLPSR